jgi:hypothetical protein
MKKCVKAVANNCNTMIRTVRANPAILDRIMVRGWPGLLAAAGPGLVLGLAAWGLPWGCLGPGLGRPVQQAGAGPARSSGRHPAGQRRRPAALGRCRPCPQALCPSIPYTTRHHPSHPCPQVDYYGAMTPLKQLSGISTPDASTILISPFDKTSIKAIEKAINESDVSGVRAGAWLAAAMTCWV